MHAHVHSITARNVCVCVSLSRVQSQLARRNCIWLTQRSTAHMHKQPPRQQVQLHARARDNLSRLIEGTTTFQRFAQHIPWLSGSAAAGIAAAAVAAQHAQTDIALHYTTLNVCRKHFHKSCSARICHAHKAPNPTTQNVNSGCAKYCTNDTHAHRMLHAPFGKQFASRERGSVLVNDVCRAANCIETISVLSWSRVSRISSMNKDCICNV